MKKVHGYCIFLGMKQVTPCFLKFLRNYYESYKYKSASTKDFENVCEKVSGKNLSSFFEQWVFIGSGIINLDYSWKPNKSSNNCNITLNVDQTQTEYDTYNFPLDMKILFNDYTNGV